MKRPTDAAIDALFDQATNPDAKYAGVIDNPALFTETLKRKLYVGCLDVIDELIYVATHSNHTAPKVTACRTLLALAKECGVLDLDPVKNFLDGVTNDPTFNLDLRRED
jgi:hypothetical protein